LFKEEPAKAINLMKSSQTSIDKQELLQFKWTVSSHLMVHKHLISLE